MSDRLSGVIKKTSRSECIISVLKLVCIEIGVHIQKVLLTMYKKYSKRFFNSIKKVN